MSVPENTTTDTILECVAHICEIGTPSPKANQIGITVSDMDELVRSLHNQRTSEASTVFDNLVKLIGKPKKLGTAVWVAKLVRCMSNDPGLVDGRVIHAIRNSTEADRMHYASEGLHDFVEIVLSVVD